MALLLRQFQENARRSIARYWRPVAAPPGNRDVEFPRSLGLAEEFDLSMCLDTGHVLAGFSGPLTVYEALEACLPRLGEVHLHDAPWQGPERQRGYGKDHQPLGAGDLDVGRLLDRLQAAGFGGPVIFELRLEQALASLEVIRGLRPAYIDGESG
jgi:sugar phosphate isomerase/epimerase